MCRGSENSSEIKIIFGTKNISKMTVADRIKFLRGPLTRQEFADRLGVSKATIQNYEMRGMLPKGEVLKKIAREFDVSVDWLLGTEDFGRNKKNDMTIHDAPGLWGRTKRDTIDGKVFEITEFTPHKETKNEKDMEGLGSAIEKLIHILNSGNPVLIHAIISNH